MQTRAPIVVLDACVLANQTTADLMLRLAEDPALIFPRWSPLILREVRRTHRKLGWPDPLAESWQTEVTACFPEAAFDASMEVIEQLTNHIKDRHVLGAAIASRADTIITFNLRDFPSSTLAPWGIRAAHPDDFVQELYRRKPTVVTQKISGMAKRLGETRTLEKLRQHLPQLAQTLARNPSP
jgi:predicted nucleic acid-binding protein